MVKTLRNRLAVSNSALFCIVTACLLSGRLRPADDGPEALAGLRGIVAAVAPASVRLDS
jgi:hypothetical protein